jgi:hypothetical protein
MSISSIDVSSNLNPLITERSSLGLPSKIWGNAYIRDLSISNLDVSGNITPLIPNNSNLGSSLNRWNRLFSGDLSINTINGQAYTSGGGTINLASITSNIIPSTTNTFNLGSRTNYWNNGYIRNLVTSARAYQGISGDISGGNFGDISWSAVNGYYGLAKDAYPALNPRSSGALAVRTWTYRTVENIDWKGVCWSPELRIFVAVAFQRVMTSSNGINWTSISPGIQNINPISVCWSPQLRLFVAVALYANTPYRVMTSPDGTTWTPRTTPETGYEQMTSICWSAELGIFVAVSFDGYRVITSPDGTNWTPRSQGVPANLWYGVCWSPQLGIFVAVASNGSNRVMTSPNGITWTGRLAAQDNQWRSVCWSPELGIFVAVAVTGINNRVMTSPNGINWTSRFTSEGNQWSSVCWSAELRIFVAVATDGTNKRIMTSPDGTTWTGITIDTLPWWSVCWSPELGIFAVVGGSGTNRVLTSSLKGRPPTSYNVFDSSFNSINETGRWDFSNITVTTMRAGGTNVTSDNRLKHNEIAITNGLTIIDKLVPKFYQKTFDMLDASYNGDLSGHSCTYEAGLIAQEVLQISDLSYVVSGGDYYEKIIKYYDTSANYYDTISNYYDTSANYYDTSSNYEISYNLVTQSYSLNYNSIFVYGLAAIKELHAKVKIIETNSLDEQLNSLVTRLEALEQNIS